MDSFAGIFIKSNLPTGRIKEEEVDPKVLAENLKEINASKKN